MILASCTGVFEPGEAERLRQAQARWVAQGIDDYTFETRTLCFCGPEVYEWAIVEVRNDRVVSATTLDGLPLNEYGLGARKTVNQLFETAWTARGEWIADVDFSFDSQLGYPTEIDLIAKKNVADGGATYEARNLEPLMEPFSPGG